MFNFPNIDEFASLVELARWQAKNNPDQKVITFLPNGEDLSIDLTFAELDHRAQTAAAWFQGTAKAGDRAIILCPTGIEYIVGLFACFYAGIIPVLTNVPRPNSPLDALQATVDDSGAVMVISTGAMLSALEAKVQQSRLNALGWFALDQIPADITLNTYLLPPLSREAVALLLYTSGSTSVPKGVIFTHGGILHEINPVSDRLHFNSESIFVSWAPFYHIAGIYWVFIMLGKGLRFVFMPTQSFMERPARWLEVITRYHGTASVSLNFGLQISVNQINLEKRADFDLSSWTLCLVGGERVRADLLEQFAAGFLPCGFNRSAFTPLYASTEFLGFGSGEMRSSGYKTYTVDQTAFEYNEVKLVDCADSKDLVHVGCGTFLPGKRIVIVDPETGKLSPPNRIGEIWIESKHISPGYWNHPQETLESFNAFIAETREGPFFRSGDLGFIYQDDLVITGRIKDLVIIHGKNYYSQDFENVVNYCHPAISPGGSAAFPVIIDNEERLAILCEIKKDFTNLDAVEVIRAVRLAVAKAQQQTVYIVALVKVGTLPRTASGKLQRFACREALMANRLETIFVSRQDELSAGTPAEKTGYVAPSTPIERALVGIWSSILHVEHIGVNDNFFELGGDSLKGTQILSQVEDVFLVEVPVSVTFELPTVAALARRIEDLRRKPAG